MRLLIVSEFIERRQGAEFPYTPSYDVQLDVSNLNDPKDFYASLFDYDVAIVHITMPSYHSMGYHKNMPKLLQDAKVALDHGRSIICIPGSMNFRPETLNDKGPPVYYWLSQLGIELQDNIGQDLKASGAGRAQVIQQYLKSAPIYYQIILNPETVPQDRLAVVSDTQIVVGLEHKVGHGTLVILPPPALEEESYILSMMNLVDVARRYHERSQRHVPIGDAPEWLPEKMVPRAKELDAQISKLEAEKVEYDKLAYVLYGTGTDLEDSVELLLRKFGLTVDRQPAGANIDLKANHPGLNLGFGIEVTGTKGTIGKDSNKVGQAWQYISDSAGTPEENNRLLIVANTELHLVPGARQRESFTREVVDLLGNKNGVLLITTLQLYDLWKSVHEGSKTAEEVVQDLHGKSGLF